MEDQNRIFKQLNICEYTIEERFFSRRNDVCKLHAKRISGEEFFIVLKIFNCGKIQDEFTVINALQGIRVPKVLAKSGNTIYLEYISGPTFLAAFESSEAKGEPCNKLIEQFVDFLRSFYDALPGSIYGDVNFRNFIVGSGGVYGVDFENVHTGSKETDIGKAVAFLQTYNPAFTDYKKGMAEFLIQYSAAELNLDISSILNAAEKEFQNMELRRNKKK
ncbi:MAG: hypothetical protein WCQ54_11890 [Clostridiaceae bacterium]